MVVTIVSENNVAEHMNVDNDSDVCSILAIVVIKKYKQSKASRCVIQNKCSLINPELNFTLIYTSHRGVDTHVEYTVRAKHTDIVKYNFIKLILKIKGLVNEVIK